MNNYIQSKKKKSKKTPKNETIKDTKKTTRKYSKKGKQAKKKKTVDPQQTQEIGREVTEQERKGITSFQNTRLSAAVSHFFNLENFFKDYLHQQDIRLIRSQFQRLGEASSVITQIRNGAHYSDGMSKYSAGLDILESKDEAVFGGKFDIEALLLMLENEHEVKEITCPICKRTPPSNPYRSDDVSTKVEIPLQ